MPKSIFYQALLVLTFLAFFVEANLRSYAIENKRVLETTGAGSGTTFGNLTIYAYPNMDRESDPINLYNMLISQPVIPKNIIFKILDVSNTKRILAKTYLISRMLKFFPANQFNFIALINVASMASGYSLNTNDADLIFQAIQNTTQLAQFSSITIDAEPVYAWNSDPSKTVNSIDFHVRLIELINQKLNLPVSFYMSPARIANANGLIYKNPTDWKFLLKTLGTQNTVFIPAYSYAADPVRQDDIANAVKALGKVPYQLTFDSRDDTALKLRLEWAHEKNLYGNGTAIFSLSVTEPLQASTMNLIGSYMRNITNS